MTGYRLDFPQRHSYASESAITVPITIISDIDTYVDFSAKLDNEVGGITYASEAISASDRVQSHVITTYYARG